MKLTKKERAGRALWGRILEAMSEADIKKQADLARSLDVTSQTISGWKRGAWMPKRENFIALSMLSGMSIHYLETGEGRKFSDPESELEDRVLSNIRRLPDDVQERVLAITEFELQQFLSRPK